MVKRKTKRNIFNWVVLLVSILLCLLFVEVLFRFLIFLNLFSYVAADSTEKDSHFPGIYSKFSPRLNLSLDTMQFSTNSLGFRTKEYNPKTKSIVVLGDSVTFGYGVNDSQTYPYLLEKKIAYSNYSVYNLAIPVYTTFQYYSILRQYAKYFKPDIIILGLYSNDLFFVGYCHRHPATKYITRKKNYLIDNIRFFLHSNSILYQIISYELSILDCLPSSKEKKVYQDIFFFEKSLELIDDYSKRNDIPFYVVLLPMPFVNRTLDSLELYDGMYSFLEKKNIQYIDIATYYPGVLGKDYMTGILEPDGTIDDHPSVYGHQLISDAIFDNIKNNIL